MKKLLFFVLILFLITACNEETNDVNQVDVQGLELQKSTRMNDDFTLPEMDVNYTEQEEEVVLQLRNGLPAIELGIWYPYGTNQGVPSVATFAANGINATFIPLDVDAAALAAYDVIFFGRAGMAGQFPTGAGVITNLPALMTWVNNGGSIMGESEAFIFDSDNWRGVNWSSQLSTIAGVWSTTPDGWDVGYINPGASVTDPTHPITAGVSAAFTLTGTVAIEDNSYLDLTRNPTAVQVASVAGAPVVAANFGFGHSVFFPVAPGWVSSFSYALNPDYEQLFINAVLWCGYKDILVDIDIQPDDYPNYFNNNGHGVLPVAIFGSATFDVADIDVPTISLEGMPVKQKPNGKYMAHFEHVDGDGYIDMVIQLEDIDGTFPPDATEALLTGQLLNGMAFFGTDEIIIE